MDRFSAQRSRPRILVGGASWTTSLGHQLGPLILPWPLTWVGGATHGATVFGRLKNVWRHRVFVSRSARRRTEERLRVRTTECCSTVVLPLGNFAGK